MEEKQDKLIEQTVEELKNANEEKLKETITNWYEQIRTQSMKIGAKYIAAGVLGIIQKHTKKAGKISLRDYERMTQELIKVISVQVNQEETKKESKDDRATEETGNTNS